VPAVSRSATQLSDPHEACFNLLTVGLLWGTHEKFRAVGVGFLRGMVVGLRWGWWSVKSVVRDVERVAINPPTVSRPILFTAATARGGTMPEPKREMLTPEEIEALCSASSLVPTPTVSGQSGR
jgi:hypothetical protein